MRSLHGTGIGAFVAACLGASIEAHAQVLPPSPPLASTAPPAACPRGFDADLVPAALRDTRVVAFGEFHGTEEHPRLIGDYLCALVHLDPHRPVVFAWEFESGEQGLVDAYLDSPGHPDDIARLLAGRQWQGAPDKLGELHGYQDGRTSQAGLALIERIRQLRAAGYPVSIALFIDADAAQAAGASPNGSIEDNDRTNEAAYTAGMLKALAAHPEARFVIEAGNLHVATRRDAMNRPGFLTMGQRLRQAGIDIVSLKAIYTGDHNHTWECQPVGYTGGPITPDVVQCGIFPDPEATTFHPTPAIRLDAYDGTFFVGATHASPPAVGAKP